jgi:hypothetical protein
MPCIKTESAIKNFNLVIMESIKYLPNKGMLRIQSRHFSLILLANTFANHGENGMVLQEDPLRIIVSSRVAASVSPAESKIH